MIDEGKLDLVLRELGELKLALAKRAEPKLDMARAEVMEELGYEPDQTKEFYQFAYRIGLKPYRQGHYRRADVKDRVARAAFKKQGRAA